MAESRAVSRRVEPSTEEQGDASSSPSVAAAAAARKRSDFEDARNEHERKCMGLYRRIYPPSGPNAEELEARYARLIVESNKLFQSEHLGDLANASSSRGTRSESSPSTSPDKAAATTTTPASSAGDGAAGGGPLFTSPKRSRGGSGVARRPRSGAPVHATTLSAFEDRLLEELNKQSACCSNKTEAETAVVLARIRKEFGLHSCVKSPLFKNPFYSIIVFIVFLCSILIESKSGHHEYHEQSFSTRFFILLYCILFVSLSFVIVIMS